MRRKSVPHYWEAAVLRFCRQFRYRASAISVWVQPQSATKKCLPLEGKVSAKPTDEVKFNPCALRTHIAIHYQLSAIGYPLFTCRRSLRVTDEVKFKSVCSRQAQSASKKPMRSSSPSLSQRKSSLSSLPSLMRSRFSTCFESIGSVILPRIAAARQSPRSMPW